jgi:hypothetical protein
MAKDEKGRTRFPGAAFFYVQVETHCMRLLHLVGLNNHQIAAALRRMQCVSTRSGWLDCATLLP